MVIKPNLLPLLDRSESLYPSNPTLPRPLLVLGEYLTQPGTQNHHLLHLDHLLQRRPCGLCSKEL